MVSFCYYNDMKSKYLISFIGPPVLDEDEDEDVDDLTLSNESNYSVISN